MHYAFMYLLPPETQTSRVVKYIFNCIEYSEDSHDSF